MPGTCGFELSSLDSLELKCDGIAALALLTLGLDPMRIIDAVKKLEEFNQRFSVAPNATDYPTLHDRKQLMTTLINRSWAAKTRTAPNAGRS